MSLKCSRGIFSTFALHREHSRYITMHIGMVLHLVMTCYSYSYSSEGPENWWEEDYWWSRQSKQRSVEASSVTAYVFLYLMWPTTFRMFRGWLGLQMHPRFIPHEILFYWYYTVRQYLQNSLLTVILMQTNLIYIEIIMYSFN